MEKQATQKRGGYLEALLTGCPVAIMATNSEGIITFANNEACKLVEREMNELIGTGIADVYENLTAAQETNRQLYMHGGTIRDHESKVRTKSGKIINVRISASHMKDSAGNYIGAVGYFESFRPWTCAEEQMQARIMELASRLEEWKDLSTPVFELFPEVSAMVLVGNLDANRFDRITVNILAHLKNIRTRVVIIDVSTIFSCDATTANRLLRTIRMVNLAGAQCILAGIQPCMAQALEPLVSDVSSIKSFCSTHLALEAALDSVGFKIDRKDNS